MTVSGLRRAKAALSSGCKTREGQAGRLGMAERFAVPRKPVTPVEGRDLSSTLTQQVVRDLQLRKLFRNCRRRCTRKRRQKPAIASPRCTDNLAGTAADEQPSTGRGPGNQRLRAPLSIAFGQPEHLTPTKAHQRRGSVTLILRAARSCNTLIRSISVRLIAITVIGPKLPNQNRGE